MEGESGTVEAERKKRAHGTYGVGAKLRGQPGPPERPARGSESN